MSRLIDAKLAATGQRDVCEQAPALILHRVARDIVLLHARHEGAYVIAHEIELMHIVLGRGMNGHLSGR